MIRSVPGWVKPPAIEVNSINPIPAGERHGRVSGQFFLWYASNANVFNVVLGGFAVVLGLNLFWGVAAVVLGTLVGMMFTGLHAVQGARLGVPQMIQSRGQFGFYGAVVLFAAGIVLDVGYQAGGQVVGGQALNGVVPGVSVPVWVALFAAPVIILAVWGYRAIHAIQPALTVIMTGVLVAVVVLAARSGAHLAHGMGGIGWPPLPVFLVCTGIYFMNMLSWAIYVSDYSRYLRADVPARGVFWAVFTGSSASTVLFCAVGVWVTATAPAADPVTSLAAITGRWIYPFAALSLITGAVLNTYTGMLSVESLRSAWQHVRPSVAARIAGAAAITAAATVLGVAGWHSLVTTFSNFLGVLLFVFVPWSAINLVDFYLVQKERYDVASFYTPRGVYGRWRLTACVPFLVALACELPFVDQADFKGPLVGVVGGADISWLAGMVAAAAGYLLAVRIERPGPLLLRADGDLEEAGLR
jgi:nucleobase:cation symporter-1, NCS1 family